MKMSLGAFIAQLRKEHGLTQKQLSEILGVSDKTVSHWEREESSPDISILLLIAETFSITTDELLRGERATVQNENSSIEESVQIRPAPVYYKKEDDFHRFKTLNIIAAAASGIAFLVGLCTFLFLGILIIAFDLLVFGASAICTWILYYNYIYKNGDNSHMREKALRITTIVSYCNSSFALIAVTSLFINVISVFVLLSFIVAPVICLCVELLLRKKGILPKDPKWPEPRRKRLKLKLSCTAIAVLLLSGALFANTEYHPYSTILDRTEYIEFADRHSFEEYISAEVPAPKEKYADKYDLPYDIKSLFDDDEERCFVDYKNDTGSRYSMLFDYGNKEVLKIKTSDGNGFPVKCYTHSALIEAEKQAEPQIKTIRICLLLLYPASIATAFYIYFAIKKKKEL